MTSNQLQSILLHVIVSSYFTKQNEPVFTPLPQIITKSDTAKRPYFSVQMTSEITAISDI